MKILDRYILKEVAAPFVFGVATFTLLFVSGGVLFQVAKLMVEGHASLGVAFTFLMNMLPGILFYTFPMSVLLACLLSFGRLSGESELVAMKAGGIRFLRICMPGIIFALVISFLALYVSDSLAPDSTYRANNIFLQYMTQDAGNIVKENIVLRETTKDGSERMIYIRRFEEKTASLQDIFIHYFKDGRRVREVFAPSAAWVNNMWVLHAPRTYDFGPEQSLTLESRSLEAQLPLQQSLQDFAKRERHYHDEMTRAQLKQTLKDILSTEKQKTSKYKEIEVFLAQKLSVPFSCFVFGLFGIPLGTRPHRTSTSIGLGLSLIFIFIYYVIMTLGMSLGKNGTLPPDLACWLPNIIFGAVGALMLWQLDTKN